MRQLLLCLFATTSALAAPWISEQPRGGDFPLVQDGQAATIVFSPDDFKVVGITAHDLAADIERVTGRRPVVGPGGAGPAVLLGTLGSSPLINGLVDAGKLDNYVTVATKLTVPAAGLHTLGIYGVDAGVVLTKLVIK